jgi:hypothetical protein
MQALGCRLLDAGSWMQALGCRLLDAGSWLNPFSDTPTLAMAQLRID